MIKPVKRLGLSDSAHIKELRKYINYQDAKLKKIKKAFTDYVYTEGCNCCENTYGHEVAKNELGELLGFKKKKSENGNEWYDISMD